MIKHPWSTLWKIFEIKKKKYWLWRGKAKKKKKSGPMLTAAIHNFNKDLAKMVQEQKQAIPWIHCKDWWMAQWSLLIVWCDRFITPRTKCRGERARFKSSQNYARQTAQRCSLGVRPPLSHAAPICNSSPPIHIHHRSVVWSPTAVKRGLTIDEAWGLPTTPPPSLGQISVGSGGMRQ